MNLYVSADMEGTAGVCSWAQVDPSNVHEYPVYRRYMSREVAAAIAGARDASPCEVLVNDSHWNMHNVLWDELPDDVRMISGARKPLSMAEGAQQRYDAAFFTGYHGMIGTPDAVLAHTYSNETIYRVFVNGRACSEALLNAALLGIEGTPVVLVTGDRATVEQTLEDLPWATGVAVKEAIGYYAANSMTPAAACEAIRSGARTAIANLERAKPFTFEPPIELIIETAGVEHADFIELLPRFERTGGRSVRFVSNDYIAAFQAFLVAMRLASAANLPA
ncbi:MAG TPA: M55 family metallopeptidase [Candidatus Aquilonibacter sp.]|nr:M55 family metallopeptidase [Candidatus Aquilonibacter sp.]